MAICIALTASSQRDTSGGGNPRSLHACRASAHEVTMPGVFSMHIVRFRTGGTIMLFSDRRSSLAVAADILRINGSKTAIMYGGNLSYAQTQRYLRALMEQGLLEIVDVGTGRNAYQATDKGRKFLLLIDDLEDLVGVSRPDPASQDAQFPLVLKPYLMPGGNTNGSAS